MMCNHWSDEKMIDFILNKGSIEDSSLIKQSLQTCEYCHEQYDMWKRILPMESELVMPPSHVKQGILKAYHRSVRKKIKIASANYWKMSFGVLLLILLFGPILLKFFSHVDESNSEMAVYKMVPEMSNPATGYIEVNNRTGEFYLLVDGLLPINNMDYQVWIKTDNDLHNIGILAIENGRAQIYLDEGPNDQIEYMMLSIEPKGGSPTPSEDFTYLIKLDSRK